MDSLQQSACSNSTSSEKDQVKEISSTCTSDDSPGISRLQNAYYLRTAGVGIIVKISALAL